MILRIDSQLSQIDEQEFYKYVKDLKKQNCSYYNSIKLKNLFDGKLNSNFNSRFHHIFRVASKIILEEKIPQCLITSKKISK